MGRRACRDPPACAWGLLWARGSCQLRSPGVGPIQALSASEGIVRDGTSCQPRSPGSRLGAFMREGIVRAAIPRRWSHTSPERERGDPAGWDVVPDPIPRLAPGGFYGKAIPPKNSLPSLFFRVPGCKVQSGHETLQRQAAVTSFSQSGAFLPTARAAARDGGDQPHLRAGGKRAERR